MFEQATLYNAQPKTPLSHSRQIIKAMSDSLIPERPIVVSPSLASSIGLEQAILLQHLESLLALGVSQHNNGYQWTNITLASLVEQLPFWSAAAVRRILQQLIDLGMILTDHFPVNEQQSFACAINQQTAAGAVQTRAKPPIAAQNHQPSAALGAHRIPKNWQPNHSVLTQLEHRGVTPEFIASAVDDFVFYWSERNETSHAWSSKFLKNVQRRWEQEQNRLNQQANENHRQPLHGDKTKIAKQWQPSLDAIEILERMGINANFIDDAIAEFVLYWAERGDEQNTWNSKFVSHVKRQWAQFTHTLKHDTEPRVIGDQWQPDHEVFDVLTIANIDARFARELVPEFVLFWKDKNELHHSWNTKFLQHVKFRWARRDQQNTSSKGDAFERLTDRSWAADLV